MTLAEMQFVPPDLIPVSAEILFSMAWLILIRSVRQGQEEHADASSSPTDSLGAALNGFPTTSCPC
ncbi:MAG: hypothetical protein IPP85_14230 [Propionivibrio sp.]|nr:hypothetical protein [Propionivibrio sp.]